MEDVSRITLYIRVRILMGVGMARGQSHLMTGLHIMANGQTTAFMEMVSSVLATIPDLPGAHIMVSGVRRIHSYMAMGLFRSTMARFMSVGG